MSDCSKDKLEISTKILQALINSLGSTGCTMDDLVNHAIEGTERLLEYASSKTLTRQEKEKLEEHMLKTEEYLKEIEK